jgi:hypothetical protein
MELANADLYLNTPRLTQPCPPLTGPFRDNIHAFLSASAEKVAVNGVKGVTAHVVPVQIGTHEFLLHVYEEQYAEDSTPVCDSCRCMGKFLLVVPRVMTGTCSVCLYCCA